MNVLIHHQYRASRKEQLAVMLRRILASFAAAGLVPTIDASFADSANAGRVSAVARALKKYPELAGFVTAEPSFPGLPATKRLAGSSATSPLPLDAVLALAEGVPRSLPFDSIHIQLAHPDFDGAGSEAHFLGGVIVGDSWWVNGQESTAERRLHGQLKSGLPGTAAADCGGANLIAGLGKPRKSSTQVIPDSTEAKLNETVRAARELVAGYRSSMPDLVARADPPNELPTLDEVLLAAQPATGPLKPALVAAFAPRGFDLSR